MSMKRLLSISYFFILLSCSSVIFSSGLAEFTEEAIEDALTTAAKAALEEGAELSAEAASNISKAAETMSSTFTKMSEDAAVAMSNLGEEAFGEASSAFSKGLETVMQDTLKSITELSSETGETVASKIADLVSEDGAKLTESLTSGSTKAFEDAISELPEATQTALKDSFSTAQEATESLETAGAKTAEDATKTAEDAGAKTAEGAGAKGADFDEDPIDFKDNSADLAKAAEEAAAKTAKDTATAGKFFAEVGKLLATSVLMMLPQSIMTGITAENTRNAMLATISAPIKFAGEHGYVAQIPSQFIDTEVPANTLYLYVLLPLASTTQKITSDMALRWPGLNGSGTGGAPGGDSITAEYTVVGGTTDTDALARYTLDPIFLQNAKWVCTHPSNSTVTNWGITYINSTSSPEQFIVLNNGYVFVADGTDGNNAPIPLIGSDVTVLSGVTDLYGDIQNVGTTYTYTQSIDVNAKESKNAETTTDDSSGTTSNVVTRLFDCACLDGSGVNYSNAEKTCVTDGSNPLQTCLLGPSMKTLAAGTVIAADGNESDNWDILEGHALDGTEVGGLVETATSDGAPDMTAMNTATAVWGVISPLLEAGITAGFGSIGSDTKKTDAAKTASTDQAKPSE